MAPRRRRVGYVLDSSAMVAFLRDEEGAELLEAILRDRRSVCHAHVLNLCEVFYDFVRTDGEATARGVLDTLRSAHVRSRRDVDPRFWQGVGLLKAQHRRVSLADCFCITLAQRVGGEVLTTDHHEFDRLVPLGICHIRFLR